MSGRHRRRLQRFPIDPVERRKALTGVALLVAGATVLWGLILGIPPVLADIDSLLGGIARLGD